MMVQKFCPTCKDLIPVACKSCPCGHKFIKTVVEPVKTDNSSSENDGALGREENGRPRRRSAMNSLYYHSPLQLSSYRLVRHAAQAKKSPTGSPSPGEANGEEKPEDPPETKGRLRTRRKRRGRPRLTPLPESERDSPDEEKDSETKSKTEEEEEIIPTLRRRRPGLMYNNLRTPKDIYEHPPGEPNSKSGKANKQINDSESYGKLYQTLSEERKLHFAHILSDINFKFKKNASFPLD